MLALAVVCALYVLAAARPDERGGKREAAEQEQRTTVLLSGAQRRRINAAFARAGWQSLEQTTPQHRRPATRTAKVKRVVAKLQDLLGQAASVRAYGDVYRPYGDTWRGRKSVLHPEVDQNGQQLTDESGDAENALAGQAGASEEAAAPSPSARSQAAEPAAAYTSLPPCNAGGGAVVYSSNCAPYPYGGLPLFQTPVDGSRYGSTGQFVSSFPFGPESAPQNIAKNAVSVGASMGELGKPDPKKRQSFIAAAIAAGVAAPSPGSAMPAWAMTDIPRSQSGGLPSQADAPCPPGTAAAGCPPAGNDAVYGGDKDYMEGMISGGAASAAPGQPLHGSMPLSSAMDAYINAGVSADSGLGGPVALQPVVVRGQAVAGRLPAHGGSLSQRLVADESAIATLTKDVNELLTANQYLMTEAALGGRPGPRGVDGRRGPSGPPVRCSLFTLVECRLIRVLSLLSQAPPLSRALAPLSSVALIACSLPPLFAFFAGAPKVLPALMSRIATGERYS